MFEPTTPVQKAIYDLTASGLTAAQVYEHLHTGKAPIPAKLDVFHLYAMYKAKINLAKEIALAKHEAKALRNQPHLWASRIASHG